MFHSRISLRALAILVKQSKQTMSGESRGHILPVGAELLDSQVAGHRFGASKTKLGLLRHSESGDILKPIHDKRSNREHQFYETIFDTANDNDECTVRLRNLVPRFKGLFEDIRTNRKYIRLDSATKTMLHPSLLDAKIGAITYDPEASEVKKHSELNKYRYAKDLGFRILGMKIFDPVTNTYITKSKEFGLTVTPDNASEALLTFVKHDIDLLKEFQRQLGIIEEWFRTHNVNRWMFISSSLLFVYDHQVQHNALNGDEKKSSRRVATVKIIDFAHVFPNQSGHDDNYIFGLSNLLHYIQMAIDK